MNNFSSHLIGIINGYYLGTIISDGFNKGFNFWYGVGITISVVIFIKLSIKFTNEDDKNDTT